MGVNAVEAPWTQDLWSKLEHLCPLPAGLHKLPETPRPFRWNVRAVATTKTVEAESTIDSNVENAYGNGDMYADCTDAVFDRPFVARVVVSAEHQKHCGRVR